MGTTESRTQADAGNNTAAAEPPKSFSQWATNWLYWNGGGAKIATALGRPPKKFGIRNPIVVYQMGKVGSSSVFYGLTALKLDVPVYHLHILNDFDEMEDIMRHVDPDRDVGPRMLNKGRQVRAEMAEQPRQMWDFISLVRQPIPRQLSAFFESATFIFPNFEERLKSQDLTVPELVDFFLNEYLDEWPLWWFEKQMQAPFGIDVYATPFDRARGYQFYRHGNVRMLLMRLEDLNRVAAPAMSDFLKIPNFQLVHTNVGETKYYSELYREFLKQVRLPSAYVEKWNGSRVARHFYSEQELAAGVVRWT